MIQKRNRLGIIGLEHPNFFDPIPVKFGIEFFKRRQKTFQQFLIAHRKIFMTVFEIISGINNVIAAKILGRHKIRMFHQCQEWIALFLR